MIGSFYLGIYYIEVYTINKKPINRRELFVNLYKGNATEAALAAGYSKKTAYAQGHRLLKDAEIVKKILDREVKQINLAVMDRNERELFLTKVINDPHEHMSNKLKSLDILNKMQGVYLSKVEVSGEIKNIAPQTIIYIPENMRDKIIEETIGSNTDNGNKL